MASQNRLQKEARDFCKHGSVFLSFRLELETDPIVAGARDAMIGRTVSPRRDVRDWSDWFIVAAGSHVPQEDGRNERPNEPRRPSIISSHLGVFCLPSGKRRQREDDKKGSESGE